MILYCIVTAFVNAVASLILGASVFLKNVRDGKNAVFGLFTMSVSAWSAFYVLWQVATDVPSALAYTRGVSFCAIFIPLCYFHFSTLLAGRRSSKLRRELKIGYATALLLGGLSLTTLMITGVEPRGGFPHWPVAGVLYPVYLMHFFYFTVRTVMVLYRAYTAAVSATRAQLGYVYYATVIGFIGGSTNFFLWYSIPIPPVGNGLVGAYIFVVSYAVVRFRLLEVDYVLVKGLAVVLAILALAVPMPVIVIILTYLTGGSLDSEMILLLCGVSLLVTPAMFFGIPLLRYRLDHFIENRLLRVRLGYRGQMREVTRSISSLHEEADIFHQAVRVVIEALGATRALVLVRGELELDYKVRSSINFASSFPIGASLKDDHIVVRLGRGTSSGRLLDELRTTVGASPEEKREVAELQRFHHVEVLVPILADVTFFGILLLGPRSAGRAYSDSDLSLLDALCVQIALSLRSRQLERRMNQTEKLISLGTLAAGLAHEIRNPMVSIRTFSDLIAEHHGDPDFMKEFGSVVRRDIARIGTIVENISAFAENNQVVLAPVSAADVVRAVQDILKRELQDTGTAFVLESNACPSVRGNFGQLSQVFLNLFQNAIHAMEKREERKILVRCAGLDQSGSTRAVRVEVTDTGGGIDQELLPKIFDPFVTTKATGSEKRGMGLGLAIVKRIIDGHDGQIEVSSQAGVGTTFVVTLPVWEDASA
ncbi:MAG TPA: ATP-binding protein [Opitutaceae bacterium]|nr:ATP-binding protein [Opitutaceae bacterium]